MMGNTPLFFVMGGGYFNLLRLKFNQEITGITLRYYELR